MPNGSEMMDGIAEFRDWITSIHKTEKWIELEASDSHALSCISSTLLTDFPVSVFNYKPG